MAFDPQKAYRLDPKVALRPEPFGALAYHYGNRRLLFLKSKQLVEVLDQLAHHESAEAAVASVTKSHTNRAVLLKALTNLATTGIIGAR